MYSAFAEKGEILWQGSRGVCITLESTSNSGTYPRVLCLMTNHVHLLIQPSELKSGLAALMKRLAGRQTCYRNKMEGRSGTLWESRFKSSPVQTDQYVLACKCYIEMNPVRARMVSNPADYPWSSYSSSIGENTFSWLDFDPCYLALEATFEERRIRYRDYVNASVSEDEWALRIKGSEYLKSIFVIETARSSCGT